MNDRTIVQHPNGYSGILMGKSTMMIYDKDDNLVLHTCFRTPNTETELYECLETMPQFIDIIASVEADRKTEPTAKLCRECDDYAGDGMYCAKNHIVYDFDTCKDEPQTNADQHTQHIESVEPTQTDCWSKEKHEKFYTFLWNIINPNEMQEYIEMFEQKDEPQEKE